MILTPNFNFTTDKLVKCVSHYYVVRFYSSLLGETS